MDPGSHPSPMLLSKLTPGCLRYCSAVCSVQCAWFFLGLPTLRRKLRSPSVCKSLGFHRLTPARYSFEYLTASTRPTGFVSFSSHYTKHFVYICFHSNHKTRWVFRSFFCPAFLYIRVSRVRVVPEVLSSILDLQLHDFIEVSTCFMRGGALIIQVISFLFNVLFFNYSSAGVPVPAARRGAPAVSWLPQLHLARSRVLRGNLWQVFLLSSPFIHATSLKRKKEKNFLLKLFKKPCPYSSLIYCIQAAGPGFWGAGDSHQSDDQEQGQGQGGRGAAEGSAQQGTSWQCCPSPEKGWKSLSKV